MSKRTRAEEDWEGVAPATKAAIRRHGWDELKLAYQTGRLRFLAGVGAKVAAEISLLWAPPLPWRMSRASWLGK